MRLLRLLIEAAHAHGGETAAAVGNDASNGTDTQLAAAAQRAQASLVIDAPAAVRRCQQWWRITLSHAPAPPAPHNQCSQFTTQQQLHRHVLSCAAVLQACCLLRPTPPATALPQINSWQHCCRQSTSSHPTRQRLPPLWGQAARSSWCSGCWLLGPAQSA